MKKIITKIINFIYSIFKIKENKIIFESGRGKVDDNPLAIYRYLKNNSDKYELKYLTGKNTDTSSLDKKDICYYKTLKGLYHLATAKYLIKSQSTKNIIEKRKDQVYIQTWHGCGVGKKMGNDVTGHIGIVDHAKDWDYLIATDKYNKKVMCSSTGIDESIAKIVGGATTDFIVNHTKEDVERIKNKLNLKTNKKIVLYAPTFRDKELGTKVSVPIMKLASLKDYIFLIRLHPLMKNGLDLDKMPSNFIDVCDYPDIQDLLIISDILITDYSSAYFNFALLNRPMIFYVYDYDAYMSERGYYVDYKKCVPGSIVYTEDELVKTLTSKELYSKNNKDKIKEFNKKYNSYNDGKVCKRFLELLEEGYFKK